MISRGDTVKGYEYAKDQYVVITDEDLANVPLKTVRSIEIEKFVPARPAEDDAARSSSRPTTSSPRRSARRRTPCCGGARRPGPRGDLQGRDQGSRGARRANPQGTALVLETLHWPDEIRATDELDLPADDVEIKPAERKMAAQLIAAMTGEFDPAEYRDEYRAALEAGHRGQGRGARGRRARRGAARAASSST